MRIRIRLGLAIAAVAGTVAVPLTSIASSTGVSASPGTPCAPSVQCWITELTCTSKFCD